MPDLPDPSAEKPLLLYQTHDGGKTFSPTKPTYEGPRSNVIDDKVIWVVGDDAPPDTTGAEVLHPISGNLYQTRDAGQTSALPRAELLANTAPGPDAARPAESSGPGG